MYMILESKIGKLVWKVVKWAVAKETARKRLYSPVCAILESKSGKYPDLIFESVQGDCRQFEPIRKFYTIQEDFDG